MPFLHTDLSMHGKVGAQIPRPKHHKPAQHHPDPGFAEPLGNPKAEKTVPVLVLEIAFVDLGNDEE